MDFTENFAFLALNHTLAKQNSAHYSITKIQDTLLTSNKNQFSTDGIVWAQIGMTQLLNNEIIEANVSFRKSNLTVEQSLQLAKNAISLGNSQIALQILDLITASDPDARDGWYLKGELLLEQGDVLGSLACFEEGIEGRYGRFGLSDFYLRIGEIHALHLQEPDIQMAQSMYESAIAAGDFRQSVSLARVHFLNGEAYQTIGQQEKAIAEYQLVLIENPHHYWASTRLGILLWNQKQDFSESENLLLKAINTRPQEIGAYKGLGQIYLENGRLLEAKQMYEQVLQLAPTDLQAQSAIQIIENKLNH